MRLHQYWPTRYDVGTGVYLELALDERRIGGAESQNINNACNSPRSYTFVFVAQKIGVGQVVGKGGEGARVDLIVVEIAQFVPQPLESSQEICDSYGLASAPCQGVAEAQTGDVVAMFFLGSIRSRARVS